MANATVSRIGEAEGGGADPLELFLKIFSGEVLTAFETAVVLRETTRFRQIASGKSAQFPAVFKASSAYHTPGVELVGSVIPHAEVVITLDALLISDVFIADIDEAMNHYDVRAPYSAELGRELALQMDKNICRSIILSARGAALFTGDAGGSALTQANYDSDATTLISGINLAKQTMDEKDVPVDSQQVHCALKPAQWYLLANSAENIAKETSSDGASINRQSLNTISDVKILKSNALPYGVDETSGPLAKYQGDWTNSIGVVYTEDAVGTLQLIDLQLQSQFDIRRQGTLMVARYSVGHGALRTKSAVELKLA